MSLAPHVRHALRVAAVATGLVAAVAALALTVFDTVVVHHLGVTTTERLAAALDEAREASAASRQLVPTAPPIDPDDAPVYVWAVAPSGAVTSAAGTPALPRRAWHAPGTTTATVGDRTFELEAVAFGGGGWLVAGVSTVQAQHVQNVLVEAELVAGPVLLLGMFLGSLVIGVTASRPVEAARRRQLEFTADASHELRTPLTVIEAELDLALARARSPDAYRATLERVAGESARLRRIVDNLLWLGRLDAAPAPAAEPVDLATVAERCVERFAPLAAARRLDLSFERGVGPDPLVSAPADWVDRLAGVLIDNACRYTPEDGVVRVTVDSRGGRVTLTVDDSGPGIDPAERPRLFDRFHRATDQPGGTGLGLAIGDAVVRGTGGHWHVGDSPLGGARLTVSWPRIGGRRGSGPLPSAADRSTVPAEDL